MGSLVLDDVSKSIMLFSQYSYHCYFNVKNTLWHPQRLLMNKGKWKILIPVTVIETTGFKTKILVTAPPPGFISTLTDDENWYIESLHWRPWITTELFADITPTLPLNGAGTGDSNVKAPFCPVLFASVWIVGCDVLLNPIICSL